MQDYLPSKELPKRIVWGTRTYRVLGYYRVQNGRSVKTEKNKIVLINEHNEDKIITTWPTDKYQYLVKYEEIWQ